MESVSDIVTLPGDALQPAPATGADSLVQFLEGLAAIDDHMVQVLNLAALSAGEELAEAA